MPAAIAALELNEREARRMGAFAYAVNCQEQAQHLRVHGTWMADERGRFYGNLNPQDHATEKDS